MAARKKKGGLFTNRNTEKMLNQLHGKPKKASTKPKASIKRKGAARKR